MHDLELVLQPYDNHVSEAVKTLRTNIQFSGQGIKVIMFTSSQPNEGKSVVSFASAGSFAEIGKKTLYIDADIRKSVFVRRMHPRARGGEIYGLSQYLSGQKELSECIYHTNKDNLDIILSGPTAPDPTELFEGETFSELIAYARQNYDMVVIDTAPLGSVIDAAIIARECDGAIFVVECGYVGRRFLQKTRDQLLRTGVRVLGVVLNKVSNHKGGYYGSYYYGDYEDHYLDDDR